MRPTTSSAAAMMILATLGFASAQNQPAAPPVQQNQQPAQKQNPLPGSPEHQRQVEEAIKSESGRAGKHEPLPQGKSGDMVLLNGAWNVPGAPKDSQTVPSLFSERNAAIDRLPIMATRLRLTDDQRRMIMSALRNSNAPVASVDSKVSDELPRDAVMVDLPDAVKREIPDVSKLKYVRAGARILLVDPPNRIVVGEIAN